MEYKLTTYWCKKKEENVALKHAIVPLENPFAL